MEKGIDRWLSFLLTCLSVSGMRDATVWILLASPQRWTFFQLDCLLEIHLAGRLSKAIVMKCGPTSCCQREEKPFRLIRGTFLRGGYVVSWWPIITIFIDISAAAVTGSRHVEQLMSRSIRNHCSSVATLKEQDAAAGINAREAAPGGISSNSKSKNTGVNAVNRRLRTAITQQQIPNHTERCLRWPACRVGQTEPGRRVSSWGRLFDIALGNHRRVQKAGNLRSEGDCTTLLMLAARGEGWGGRVGHGAKRLDGPLLRCQTRRPPHKGALTTSLLFSKTRRKALPWVNVLFFNAYFLFPIWSFSALCWTLYYP